MAQWQREIAQQYFKQIHTMQRMYNKIVTGDDGRLKKLTLLVSLKPAVVVSIEF